MNLFSLALLLSSTTGSVSEPALSEPIPRVELSDFSLDFLSREYVQVPDNAPVMHNNVFTGSLGFTDSPDTFMLGVGFYHYLDNNLSIGPRLRFGDDDDTSLLALTLDVKYNFDIADPELRNFKPFVHGGIGVLHLSDDDIPGDDDDTGLMIDLGVGADYYVRSNFAIGTDLTIHLLPGEVLGEHSFFSWEVITFSFRF